MLLSRARLHETASVQALAPMLLPANPSDRRMAAHRLVWSLMTDGVDRTRDFLWREEKPGAFLILGPRPATTDGSLFTVEYKDWAPSLRKEDLLGFTLRANATVSVRHPGQRGKRHDVVMHALTGEGEGTRAERRPLTVVGAGAAWLEAQGTRHGFLLKSNLLTRIIHDG